MTSFPLRPDSEIENLPATTVPIDSGAPPLLGHVQIEQVEISDYLKILVSRWRLVLVAALVGCVSGVMLTLSESPSYRVKTSIEVQSINGEFLNMKQTRPVADDLAGNDALIDMQTQIELLQSQTLAENTKLAMKQFGMKREWTTSPSGFQKLVRADANGSLSDAVLDRIASSVKVRNVGQTRVLQVQVDAPNANLAADFANTLVSEYIHQNIRARTLMTEAAEDSTREQLTDMRKKLETSEQDLQRYATLHGLVFTSERQNISDDRLRQVQADLLRARAELVEKDAKRDIATTAKAETVPTIEADISLRELRAKLNDLRRQEAELLTIYKADYSEVKKVRAQAEQTQLSLDQAQERVVARINNEYKESTRKEEALTKAYNAAVQQAASESQTAVQYDILKREVDANLTAYQDMLQKVKELGLAAALRTSNIRVVDAAIPPKRANSPNLPLNIMLGLFSGLTIAIGYVVVAERSNQTLRHPGESVIRLGVPELAVVPSLHPGLRSFAPPLRGAPGDENVGLQVFQTNDMDTYAPTTDAFRSILTTIVLSSSSGKHPKSIVISSAAPGEGKTTVAGNMALVCARAGKRVLLIDGDLRNPQLHKLFSLPNEIGFGTLLQTGCDEAEAQAVISETRVAGLSVLTAGLFASAPADLLFQSHLQLLLRTYRKSFDLVLIDSPPILSVPDSRLLGRCSDGIILVARSNRTNRNSLLMACHRLGLDRSRVLGIVLNDWRGEPSPYPV